MNLLQDTGNSAPAEGNAPAASDLDKKLDRPDKPAPQLTNIKVGTRDIPATGPNRNVYLFNETTFKAVVRITGPIPENEKDDIELRIFAGTNVTPLAEVPIAEEVLAGATKDLEVPVSLNDGEYPLRALLYHTKDNTRVSNYSDQIMVKIRTIGPRVVSVVPVNFMFEQGPHAIIVQFNRENPLTEETAAKSGNYLLSRIPTNGEAKGSPVTPQGVTWQESTNSVVINYLKLRPGTYELTVKGEDTNGTKGITDVYGNKLEPSPGQTKNYVYQITKPVGGKLVTATPGISGMTGPYVKYKEWTEPREVPEGFNPSDHVETRVARLYYFRDAHRVAQIVNRDARSYNRAAVDMKRQLADDARRLADDATGKRKAAELRAIEAVRRTREAERDMIAAHQALAGAQRVAVRAQEDLVRFTNATNLTPEERERQTNAATRARDAAIQVADQARAHAESATAIVESRRREEDTANRQLAELGNKEERARADQFRREVAAAHADPDTYAPGVPGSDDPVRQVSVSVIGEGLIQLRGPIKGINIIRRMINQIDSPVGQVRVNVHTVQINGEHGDRMEKVADKIQKYIDHSRFLTTRSAEILRRAIVKVASRRAMQAVDPEAPGSQDIRDQRYLYAFFGSDFIDELRVMDSEFLKTGNKLLSLHSMDTTSLSSALFLMALAKNSTRQEILEEFQGMLAAELPPAEQSYFEAGFSGGTKRKLEDWCRRERFQLLAQNARFESLRGFFNQEVSGHDNTMTPIQREFIRLAQIFKGRLITEMELKQRVMERALIEQRGGNYAQVLARTREKEEKAKETLMAAKKALASQREKVISTLAPMIAKVDAIESLLGRIDERDLKPGGSPQPLLDAQGQEMKNEKGKRIYCQVLKGRAVKFTMESRKLAGKDVAVAQPVDVRDTRFWKDTYKEYRENMRSVRNLLNYFSFVAPDDIARLDGIESALDKVDKLSAGPAMEFAPFVLTEFRTPLQEAFERLTELKGRIVRCKRDIQQSLNVFLGEIQQSDPDFAKVYRDWLVVQSRIREYASDEAMQELTPHISAVERSLQSFMQLCADHRLALREAEASRQPLDHKKFLDMLVDDMEDKYIELLEGTRAHTANIDNYIKRLATALESDFNTQFYHPAFRGVREASRYWDVTFGQIETTGILANNRAFAKVSPHATMEFDLPKRDILIAEAMNGAKAMIDDFGALVNDPSFLALAALGSGQSPASQVGGAGGGFGSVRNVLPGLGTDMGEELLSQSGPGRAKLGSALEALIPDPAIYKFETGTGFEIRPVIQPDGQAVVFHFNYMYTTNVREPVRADEKHLGRVKRHFIDTDVQLSNYELREVSRYQVALKASRTARGVPLLEDLPGAGVLFRPLPQAESSLQENLILAQATIYPTLFDLMGLRWAPAVADLDPLRLSNAEFIVRNRRRALMNRVYDHASSQVDQFLRIPEANRRPDLYRTQESIPAVHPNGYQGPGLDYRDSELQEGYQPRRSQPQRRFIPSESPEGSPLLRPRGRSELPPGTYVERYPIDVAVPEPRQPPAPLPKSSLRIRDSYKLR